MSNVVVTRKMLVDLNKALGANSGPAARNLAPVGDLNTAYKPEQSVEEFGKLVSALKVISPDVPRGNGSIDLEDDEPTNYWLGVIWAIASLGWDYGKILANTWSKRSSRYTEEGFEAAWNAYDSNHPNPIGIGSVYMLAAKLGAIKTKASTPETTKRQTGNSPLSVLCGFSATGSSEQMKLQMLDDVFVMEALAILGQWTTLYAAPSTGKTLITLWLLQEQIKAEIIEGGKLFYINADDNHRGAVAKIEIAEQWGMQMLIPGHNGFRAGYIPDLMQKLAEAGEAKGLWGRQ